KDDFIDLTDKFGFPRHSMRNVHNHLRIQYPASPMSLSEAILTLHTDYIGGEHTNYSKWYFAAGLDLEYTICQSSNAILGTSKQSNKIKSASVLVEEMVKEGWEKEGRGVRQGCYG
ncbi:hypothetical protein PPACK8108_LOCUS10797, partial [Phakopsora pachyrhizi]